MIHFFPFVGETTSNTKTYHLQRLVAKRTQALVHSPTSMITESLW